VRGGRRYCLSSESELRVRSYVVFHRIYEAMALGMHPASLYPRRNRFAPTSERPIYILTGDDRVLPFHCKQLNRSGQITLYVGVVGLAALDLRVPGPA
jgi:hypothetical protein